MKILKNKNKILIVLFFTASILSSILDLLPLYFKVLFVVKYFCIFLTYAIGSYAVIMFIHYLIKEPLEIYKKKTSKALEIVTTLVLVIVLVFISTTTKNNAESESIKPQDSYIVDDYRNILYENAYQYTEPMIEEIIKTDNSLSIYGTEHIEGVPIAGGITFQADYERKLSGATYAYGDIIFDIYVEYDDCENITKYTMKQTLINQAIKPNEIVYSYISSYREVNNTLEYSGKTISKLTSVSSFVEIEEDILSDTQHTVLEHFTFSNEEISEATKTLVATFDTIDMTTNITAKTYTSDIDLTHSTILGSCTAGDCTYNISTENGNIDLVYEQNNEEKHVTVDIYGNTLKNDILYSYYLKEYKSGLIVSNNHRFEKFNKVFNLHGNTYLHNNSLLSGRHDYVEIKKTEYGYCINEYYERYGTQYTNAETKYMFTSIWGRDTNELILSYEHILNGSNVNHSHIFQNNPLFLEE